jgi:hypothetical protein
MIRGWYRRWRERARGERCDVCGHLLAGRTSKLVARGWDSAWAEAGAEAGDRRRRCASCDTAYWAAWRTRREAVGRDSQGRP